MNEDRPSIEEIDALQNNQQNEAYQFALERTKRRYFELCPELYRNTHGNFPGVNRDAMRKVLSFDPNSTKGLLLIGDTGKGKTTAAWMLLQKLSHVDCKMIQAVRDPEFSREYSKRLGNGSADAWIDRLCRVDILFIDDLGKAAITPRYKEQLYDVIDSRINNRKPTIVTSQYNRTKLIERFGDEDGKALVRRFIEWSEIINF